VAYFSALWIGLGNGLFLVLVSVLAIYGTVKVIFLAVKLYNVLIL